MASTSEELSGQAEQLKDSISFFRIDSTLTKSSARKAPAHKAVQIAHVNQRPARPSERPASGVRIDMQAGSDHMDDEFVSY
jgi:methyl-accepting chemotaxis protein